ncbi:uncharacterized protein EI97DRAFT_456875 [Westerdykella ornata]|uniref:Grh/CP2 DB domain-containing protein n=1 Tax=Westerdykella ornata TaxID=318751 RepID=A0A6A6JQ26_WESOR|nr:uncharacterized protein EI97DRAFT_456875 [Westerdykella ornata]KAF2278487.1 hypothetical protein EI97DRAFT_456875 [Westerdykella ornata]
MLEKGWRKKLHDRRPKTPLEVKGTGDGVTENEKPTDQPATTPAAKADKPFWRKTLHDSRPQSALGLHVAASRGDDTNGSRRDSGSSISALPAPRARNETRPKFARYLSEYLSLTAGPKPEFPFPEPWDEDAPFEPEPPVDPLFALQHIRSHIGNRGWIPLPVQHNSGILRIFEDYQKVREEKERLNDLLKNTLDDFQIAEESWGEEKSRYQDEIRRLELLIAQGAPGMVGLMEARQGSVVERPRKTPSSDQPEVVYKPMTMDQLDSEIKVRSQKAILHRPTSPSGSMAALSKKLLRQGRAEELHVGTPPTVGHQLTLSRKVKSELDLSELSTTSPDPQSNHSGGADSSERVLRTSKMPAEVTLEVGAEFEAFVALKELATLVARRRGLNAQDFVSKLMKLYETESDRGSQTDDSSLSYQHKSADYNAPVATGGEETHLHPAQLSIPPTMDERHFSFEPGDDQLVLLTDKFREWDLTRARSPSGPQSTSSSDFSENVTDDVAEASLRRVQTLSADVTIKPSKIPSPVQSPLGRTRREGPTSSLRTTQNRGRLNDRPNSSSSVQTAFRDRSSKPNEELIQNFKAAFPHVASTTRSQSIGNHSGPSLTDALDVAHHNVRHFGDHEDIKDADPTPRGNTEQWRFTPSLLDPNSFAFASFANQPPGYYTPTPGGTNTLYHSQAGDLHTPGFSFGLGTPLSLPTSEGGVHAGQPAPSGHLHGFNPHALSTQHFQNQNPFSLPSQHGPAFAPHEFSHQPSVFEHAQLGQVHEQSPLDNVMPDVEMQEQSPVVGYATQPQPFQQNMAPTLPQQPANSFRFHVTLNAPTAMIKNADEIPVTYLNKGQAYTITLVDTALPQQTSNTVLKYRTYIRISFEDEQQRQRPAACWQLWKEGRGTNEAHQRGGRLQAVEFVDPSQAGGGEVQGRPRVELESASFDGFAVTWIPVHNNPPECSLAVRFNFLSTDFSHSKGVKGIPVRLCAKTEVVSAGPGSPPEPPAMELCYCKVKLFRDHGAERKLSNDVAHVKKTIDKLKQQIAQVESGMKDFGKRKRSGSVSKTAPSSRPGKVPKHKRTWSMSSNSSASGARVAAEEDLQLKLQSLQDMFSSTRPVSVLYLKGDEHDDPDLHPVQLSGTMDLSKIDTNVDSTMWEHQSSHTGTSSIVSPTPSSQSLHSGGHRRSSFQQPAPFQPPSRMSSNEWRGHPQTATGDLKPLSAIPDGSDEPRRVQRPYSDDHALSGWIEAVGVDPSYVPPPEPMVKPVACFFVQPRVAGRVPSDNYFRAVYLLERTLKALVGGISMKADIEPTKVTRVIRINEKGLQILMDDDAVREIPEQQDMVAEFHEITSSQQPLKREWDAGSTDIQVDGDVGAIETVNSTGYELRLLF